jgi:3-methylcrotonyl-CoA carboxylase alpha subunit
MNTRLQVEHPVTELVTGVDLVEWQLRIAAGEPLPLAQEQIPLAGHAVEARIYAEAPARGYLPSVGRLERLVWPAAEAGVRIDAGVDAGDAITEHYDPMIAKLIVRGESRREALARLRAALDGTEILGVETNVALLRAVAAHPAFEAGGVSTRFLDEHHETLVGVPGDVADDDLALAALGLIGHLEREARRRGEASGDRWSPWLAGDAWRLNRDHGITLALVDEDGTHVTPTVARRDGQLSIAWDGKSRRGDGRLGEDDRVLARLDGRRLAARCLKRGHEIVLMREGRIRRVRLHDPAERDTASARAGTLSCPMPGQVIDLRVAAGDRVEPGDVLMVIEAMKMEHAVRAPVAGRVAELRYCVGDRVAEGEELLVLGPADD